MATMHCVENAGYTIFAPAPQADEEERGANPAIIAETKVDIPEASVSDAVMMLDLRNTNALMFRNSASRRIQHGLSPGRRYDRLGRTVARADNICYPCNRRPGAASRPWS